VKVAKWTNDARKAAIRNKTQVMRVVLQRVLQPASETVISMAILDRVQPNYYFPSSLDFLLLNAIEERKIIEKIEKNFA